MKLEPAVLSVPKEEARSGNHSKLNAFLGSMTRNQPSGKAVSAFPTTAAAAHKYLFILIKNP